MSAQGDPILDTIANCAAGFTEAWTNLHDRVPRIQLGRNRVSGTAAVAVPHRDPEILSPYLAAQLAVRHCYFRVVAAGAPAFWPSGRDHDRDAPLDSHDLVAVLRGIRRYVAKLDDHAVSDLRAAEKKLRPWWRDPPRPRVCSDCHADFAAMGRRDCWSCINSRKRARKGSRNR